MRSRSLLFLGLIALFIPSAHGLDLTGAGSTFVYPLISKWADQYKKITGTSVNYQSIGSGGGIKNIESKLVDFGATDMPLKSEDLKTNHLVQFPLVNGAVVIVVNLKDVKVGELKLTGDLVAKIFMGEIKKWNDPALQALNAGLKLPDTSITVVHRADGSGTTFITAHYLSNVNADWKKKLGEGTVVNWPVGVAGKGNEGIASYVKQINGSISYIEYAYALQNKMNFSQLKNDAGNFVSPSEESFMAATGSADWSKAADYNMILTNTTGQHSWPIAGSTFVLMQNIQGDSEKGRELIKFFRWCLNEGEGSAKELKYVPLSKPTLKLIEKTWKTEFKDDKGATIAQSL